MTSEYNKLFLKKLKQKNNVITGYNKLNKRGAIGDIFWVIAILFIIAIFYIIMRAIYTEIKPELLDALVGEGPDAHNRSAIPLEVIDRTINAQDYLFAFLLFGFFIFMIISSVLIDSNPAFFFVGLIMIAITLIVAPIFANTFTELTAEDELATAKEDFPVTTWIFDHYPTVIIAMGAIVAVVLYGKFGTGGEG